MVNSKFLYMKLLGFLTAIIGFSYSLTSFYNFFEVVFGQRALMNGVNIWISGIGLLFPLFVFILGVFFYFYADVFSEKKNKAIFISIILSVIISAICIIFSNINALNNVMEFVHFSFGYVLLLLNVFFLYGKYKYKY